MKKSYVVWLGSFAIIATSLYVYFHIPLLPIVLGGAFALLVTVGFNRLKRK